LLTELVRVKDRSEIFQVVRLDLDEHAVDLVSLETDILEYDVHWSMLEPLAKGRAWMTGKLIPGASGEPTAYFGVR
jgi:hypothetical protein